MPIEPTRTDDRPGTLDRLLAGGTDLLASPSTLPPAGTGGATVADRPAERFVLGEEIARGGMGEVYAARDQALGRPVAVKVLQPRLAGTAAGRRFAEEARITGQLQHPGIPPVYDLGDLPDGRPYLAMKLVKGDTLDALLKRDGPGGRWLAAFEGVCQAIGYAHARGVVHRDLKPANVMVGAFGEVQVMDWGLAKVLTVRREAGSAADPDATVPGTLIETERDESDATRAGSVLGTPAYMAPEQAIGAVDQQDWRTDVFGLGAVLCALLTGHPPYRGGDAESTRQLAARGKLDDALARLDGCGADPAVVELCKRCLSVEPGERPADAGAVADAVAALRQAADERARAAELEAERATVRAAESLKRRQVWLGLVASLAAGLLAAVGLAVWADQSRRAAVVARRDADDRRTEAEAAREREGIARRDAEGKKLLAESVQEFLECDVLLLADPAIQRGTPGFKYDAGVTLREVLVRASDNLRDRFAAHPAVEAQLRCTLGFALKGVGRVDLAISNHERGLHLLRELYGPDDSRTLWCADSLAGCYHAVGRHANARELLDDLLARRRRLLGPNHPDVLSGSLSLASILGSLGDTSAALRLEEEVLAGRSRALGPNHPDTLRAQNNLAGSYATAGRLVEADRLLADVVERKKRVLGPDHPEALRSIRNLALSHTRSGRRGDSHKLLEEVVAVSRAKLGPDHPDTLDGLNSLANSHAFFGRNAEALTLYQEAVSSWERTSGHERPDSVPPAWGAIRSLLRLNRRSEAMARIDTLLARIERMLAAGKSSRADFRPSLLEYRLHVLRDDGDASGCRATAAMWEGLNRPDPDSLLAAARMRAVATGLYARSNQPAEAAADADRAMGWLTKAVAAGFRDRRHLEQDADLDPLRGRADFQALLASLPELAPPPRPAK